MHIARACSFVTRGMTPLNVQLLSSRLLSSGRRGSSRAGCRVPTPCRRTSSSSGRPSVAFRVTRVPLAPVRPISLTALGKPRSCTKTFLKSSTLSSTSTASRRCSVDWNSFTVTSLRAWGGSSSSASSWKLFSWDDAPGSRTSAKALYAARPRSRSSPWADPTTSPSAVKISRTYDVRRSCSSRAQLERSGGAASAKHWIFAASSACAFSITSTSTWKATWASAEKEATFTPKKKKLSACIHDQKAPRSASGQLAA
mmetsp:Transcript_36100/g.93067  ORF Transcript_36100/g.93067 Transcript_36100/m.93067 type:complete len:256 (+) Transcript_36100:2006-2773(+)